MSTDPREPNTPRQPTQPEIQPPGPPPKSFPPPQPLSDDGLEAAKKESSNPPREGSGEDPAVESGVAENDPERPPQREEPLK